MSDNFFGFVKKHAPELIVRFAKEDNRFDKEGEAENILYSNFQARGAWAVGDIPVSEKWFVHLLTDDAQATYWARKTIAKRDYHDSFALEDENRQKAGYEVEKIRKEFGRHSDEAIKAVAAYNEAFAKYQEAGSKAFRQLWTTLLGVWEELFLIPENRK